MYIIVKNGIVLSHGINQQGWKYLDECKEAAVRACEKPEDVVVIYSLEEPVVTYTLKLEVEEVPGEEEPPACGCPVTPPATDGGTDDTNKEKDTLPETVTTPDDNKVENAE